MERPNLPGEVKEALGAEFEPDNFLHLLTENSFGAMLKLGICSSGEVYSCNSQKHI